MQHRLLRYVFKEVVPWYLGGVLLFLALQMTNALATTAGLLISYRVPFAEAASLFGNQVPGLLGRCLVVAVPFALLLAFGRLAKDSEFKAARAGGVRPLSLLLPLLLPALAIGGLIYYNSGWLTPQGQQKWWNAWYGVYNQSPPPPSTEKYAYAQGDTFYSAGRVQNDSGSAQAQLSGVLVIQGDTTYSAPVGRWDSAAHTWTLPGGSVVGPDGVPRPFNTPVTLPERDVLRRPAAPLDQSATPDLRQQLAVLRAQSPLPTEGSRSVAFELAHRVADAFTPFVFVLAAGALGLLLSNRAWAAAGVILFIFGFYVLWSTAPELARTGAMSPTLAAWFPNVVFLLLGGGLAWRLR
ncbi:LptF/LptG family permease [Deinococcus ruber]|uniref:LptF/LptG family permease n=1 Tax=Deinococcus ruber TaxID=1848197 RepID=UPI001665930A|nr:LptF/LptG family permease [Deinococcus ruber]